MSSCLAIQSVAAMLAGILWESKCFMAFQPFIQQSPSFPNSQTLKVAKTEALQSTLSCRNARAAPGYFCSTELDVENTIIANRRYLDASKVLLDELYDGNDSGKAMWLTVSLASWQPLLFRGQRCSIH
eukprot:1157548-Pelagomonas_calceolata.AAC.6